MDKKETEFLELIKRVDAEVSQRFEDRGENQRECTPGETRLMPCGRLPQHW